MVLHYFKKSHVLLYIPILFLFAFLFSFQYFKTSSNIISNSDEDFGFLFKYIITIIPVQSILAQIITFISIASLAVFINHIANVNMLLQQRTLLPALFFTLLIASNQNFLNFIPALFAAILLVLVISILFQFYNNPTNYIRLFDIGFVIALASFFYIPSILFILFVVAALLVYHELSLRNLLIAFSGLVVPYFFLFTYLFWFDKINVTLFFEFIERFYPKLPQIPLQSNEWIMAGFVTFIFLLSFLKIIFTQIEKVIRIRKYNFLLIWFIIISIVGLFFSHNVFQHFIFLIIPVVYFIGNFFLSLRSKRLAEILFSLLLLTVIITKLL